MFSKSFTLVSLLSLVLVENAFGQMNITVNETDSSITLVDAGDAAICQYDSDGNYVGGTAGCYNVQPSNCTDSVAMSQLSTASASFKFNGSAIFINSLMYPFSPLYSVTLDGKETDVDGYSDTKLFSCAKPLFSQSGLDPSVEHEITLATKGLSPSRNQSTTSAPTDVGVFSLISFVYTQENGTSSTSVSGSGGHSATSVGTASSPTSTGNGALSSMETPCRALVVAVLALTVVKVGFSV